MPPKAKPPPGWPFALITPDQAEPWFTDRVTEWALRQLPEELRHLPGIRDDPQVLVRLLHLQLAGALLALRAGYRTIPQDHRHLDPAGQAAARRAYTAIGRRTAARLRGVELVAMELQRRAGYPKQMSRRASAEKGQGRHKG